MDTYKQTHTGKSVGTHTHTHRQVCRHTHTHRQVCTHTHTHILTVMHICTICVVVKLKDNVYTLTQHLRKYSHPSLPLSPSLTYCLILSQAHTHTHTHTRT